MSESQIEAMYKALYDSRAKEYEIAKRKQLESLDNELKSYTNAYNSTKNQIELNKKNTANKYQEMYKDLDNQAQEGKNRYYKDRNNASVDYSKNTHAIRDYMAKHNLLQSGESVDALLRNNTDFSNNMGSIRDNENTFNKNITDTRYSYLRDETSAYANYDKSLADALAEYDLNRGRIVQNRTSAENDYLDKLEALKKEVEANKLKDLMAYQQSLIAAASSRSSGSGGGGRSYSSRGSSSSSNTSNTVRTNLANEVNYTVNNLSNFAQTRNLVEQAYLQGHISDSERSAYINRINGTMNAMKKAQASVNKGEYNGYSTTNKKNGLVSTRY